MRRIGADPGPPEPEPEDVAGPQSAAGLVEVVLLNLPVALQISSRAHGDALRRELTLIKLHGQGLDAVVEVSDSFDPGTLPIRLLELADEIMRYYRPHTTEQDDVVAAAAARGEAVLPRLVYRVPPAAADLSRRIARMLDEADEYCRAGDFLLTLETPADVRRYRTWVLTEFERQIAGEPPLPWPGDEA